MSFPLVGLFVLLLLLFYFTSLSLLRLYVRRKRHLLSTTRYFFKRRSLDSYWMMLAAQFISVALIGLALGWLRQSFDWSTALVFLDLYLLCFLNFQTHFLMNDYELLQDIALVNKRAERRNEL